MDLIDRYLYAVRDYLPRGSHDDIVRELGDDIRAQAADREEALGRPLTADDQAELLKGLGHPMVLAAKYRTSEQLISPVVYPYYLLGLKISMGMALLVQVAIAIAMVASGQPGGPIIGRLASFPFTGLVTVFGWVTLGFAALDIHVRQSASRITGTWDPHTLTEPPPQAGPRKAAWTTGIELWFSTVFFVWWLAIPQHPWLVFGPAATFLSMAPAWRAVHLPLAALWLVSLVVRWTLLFRPDLKALRPWFEIAANLAGLTVAIYLLRADAIVTVAPGLDAGANTADIARIVHAVDTGFRIAVLVWICAAVWEAVQGLWRRRGAW
jgi:hypothetical protein